MKKFVTTFATAAILTSLTACSSSSASSTPTVTAEQPTTTTYEGIALPQVDLSNAEGVLKSIIDKGVLVIGTSPDFPPSEYIDDDGNVAGAEIKMAEFVAASLGVELQVEQMDFNAVLTAVDTGKVDVGMSGFGYKKDRAENFSISHGYISQDDEGSGCHGILVTADNVNTYASLEDLSGKVVTAQASSLQEMYATDQIPDVQLELVSTLDQAILNLGTGKVDAAAVSCTSGKNYAANSDGQFVMTDITFDMTPYEEYKGTTAIAKKGEDSFIDILNVIIDYANENDLYGQWYEEAKQATGIE